MDQRSYTERRIRELTHYWLNTGLVLGTILFLLLGFMDFMVARDLFPRFFMLRNAISILLLLFFVLNKAFNSRKSQAVHNAIILAGTALSAATIEVMILTLGGHESSYYAGLNLLAICVLGFIPWDMVVSVACVVEIYLIYLVPIFWFDEITDLPAFAAHNAFLLSTFLAVLVWRGLAQRNLHRTLALQYELDKDKEQLRSYSTDLEALVRERTRKMEESELMFRALFEQANDGVITLNREGTVLTANRRACQIHGFDEGALDGVNVEFLQSDENRRLHRERWQRILDGEALLYETEHFRRDGAAVSLEVSAKAIELGGKTIVQAFFRDVTEKKKMQQHLAHTQKMESIGLLAGGIAHDFNNILTGILGYAELILEHEEADEGITDKARVIESAALNASSMVSKLLSFARRDQIEAVLFDVNGVVEDTLGMLSRLVPKNTRLEKNLAVGLPAVVGDVGQLEQVMMNLVLNARDAMPNGGRIVVGTAAVELGPSDIDIGTDIVPGLYVRVIVSDTGVGIPREKLGQIFEPFFTTKAKGKGTGLGLAMVYGIVKEHGGYITVESRQGEGTRFSVYLPASSRKISGGARRKEIDVPGGKTVLVIDDEVPVLQYIKETLQNRGFNVIVTDNPLHGLNIYRKEFRKIDLIITDVVMPVMEGHQLITSLRAVNPGARILAVSGFSEGLDTDQVDGFLKKPFTTVNLLLSIKESLDQGAS